MNNKVLIGKVRYVLHVSEFHLVKFKFMEEFVGLCGPSERVPFV